MVIDLTNKRNDSRVPIKENATAVRSEGSAKILGFPSVHGHGNRDIDQATAAILRRAKSLKW